MAPTDRSRPARGGSETFGGVGSSVPDLGPDLMSYTASEWRAWGDGYRVGRVHGIERGRELADEEAARLHVSAVRVVRAMAALEPHDELEQRRAARSEALAAAYSDQAVPWPAEPVCVDGRSRVVMTRGEVDDRRSGVKSS